MNLWIDADGFPRRQREIALKAALREGMQAVIVADRPIDDEDFPEVQKVVVEPGDDRSDAYIEAHLAEGDLVLTRDIPAMDRFIRRGAICLDDRGKLYTPENIRERLSIRDAMDEYREFAGGQPRSKQTPQKDVQGFANTLASILK